MHLVFEDFPFVINIDLSNQIDDDLNNRLLEQCIESDNRERATLRKGTYNTKLSNTDEMKYLNNIFIEQIHKLFDNIPKECMSENPNKSLGCAYVSYDDRYDSYWHNHCNRATINSVYYASVPDKEGTISVMLDNGKEGKITPLEKHLYLMPGWMLHKPNPCKSKKARASINMEFLSDTRAILKPDNFDISEYQSWDYKSFILW